MSDTQSRDRGRRSDVDNRGERGNDSREERKRPWRSEAGDRDGREDRGFKQMKPGAIGMKVLVPNSLVGAIIGKGGEEMKKLKEESSCFIRLSQNDKYFPNTNERPCYIEGVPEDIVKAIQTIQEKLANDNPRRGPSIDETRKKQCKIVVGANAAGKCIGKGGENVKRLKSEFSVWIKVMGRDDSIPGLEERTITVSGDNDNTLKAIKDILEMSVQLNNGGTDKNLDYDNFMSGAPAAGGAPAGNQGGYNQGGGYQNNQGNFNNQGGQGGYNNQMGGGTYGARAGSQGAPAPNVAPVGRSGSQGPPANNMGGFNNMGGPGPNNMGGPGPNNNMGGPGPNAPIGGPGPNMGGNMGGNFNNPAPPAQQYGSNAATQQFGQPGQFQGNIQQYPNNNSSNPSNIPIQQYPGSDSQSSGYGSNPGTGGGGYNNPNQGGGYNQGGAGSQGGYNQGGQGGYNQPPAGGNPGQGGYNQGYNNQGSSGGSGGYQGGSQGGFQGGNQSAPYQGGNQRGGFQPSESQGGGYQGGNFPGGRGGFQSSRGGNQGGGRGGFNSRGAGGRGGAPSGGASGDRGNARGRGGSRGRGGPRN